MKDRVIVSVHEAGHCVAARALHIDVVDARIGDSPGVRVRHPRHSHPYAQATFNAKEGVVSLAGPVAEMCFTGKRDADACAADQRNAEKYAARFLRLRGGLAADAAIEDGEARVAETLDRWKFRAQELVTNGWDQIRTIAVALLERGSLTGPEIEALLSET
jgi:hypothetical protein